MHYGYSAADGTRVGGAQPLRKLNRVARRLEEKKAPTVWGVPRYVGPSGHPTKRHTAWRRGYYDTARAVRMAKARLRYENILVAMYETVDGA